MSLSRLEEALLDALIGAKDVKTAYDTLIRKGVKTKRGRDPSIRDCYDALARVKKKFKRAQAFQGTIYRYIQKDPRLRRNLLPRESVDRPPKDPLR